MTQFHEWEWFTGEVPAGRVQVQTREMSRACAEITQPSKFWEWEKLPDDPRRIIAFRRVKDPVRGEVVITGVHEKLATVFGRFDHGDTHQLTLPTDDGALICGEYVGPGGAVVKVDRRG